MFYKTFLFGKQRIQYFNSYFFSNTWKPSIPIMAAINALPHPGATASANVLFNNKLASLYSFILYLITDTVSTLFLIWNLTGLSSNTCTISLTLLILFSKVSSVTYNSVGWVYLLSGALSITSTELPDFYLLAIFSSLLHIMLPTGSSLLFLLQMHK